MVWQDVLLKQVKFPIAVRDWVDTFESEDTLNKFKQVLQQYVDFGPNRFTQSINENAIKTMRQNISDKKYAEEIALYARRRNKKILGQQLTGKKSDNRIIKLVESHLKNIFEISRESTGVSRGEQLNDLLDSIVPKLRQNNPNFVEIEKEVNEFLQKTNQTNKPSVIKKPLDKRIRGQIKVISNKIYEYHTGSKPDNVSDRVVSRTPIPTLFKLFNLGAAGQYRLVTTEFTPENLIKFYRNVVTNITQTKVLLKDKVGEIYPYLYSPDTKRGLTEEFKKAIQGDKVSLKGFEQFGYVDVPLSEVKESQKLIDDKVAIKDKDKLWIQLRRAKKLQRRNVISVENIGEGKPIVVNGKPILSANKLPLEKKDILDQFEDFTLDDKSLKYWAFNHVSKIEDWKTKTQEIVQDFLKKKRRPQYIIDILVNLKMIHKEGSK